MHWTESNDMCVPVWVRPKDAEKSEQMKLFIPVIVSSRRYCSGLISSRGETVEGVQGTWETRKANELSC